MPPSPPSPLFQLAFHPDLTPALRVGRPWRASASGVLAGPLPSGAGHRRLDRRGAARAGAAAARHRPRRSGARRRLDGRPGRCTAARRPAGGAGACRRSGACCSAAGRSGPDARVADRGRARARLRLAHAADEAAVNSWAMLTAGPRGGVEPLRHPGAAARACCGSTGCAGRFAGARGGRPPRRSRFTRSVAGRHRGQRRGRLPGRDRPDVPEHARSGPTSGAPPARCSTPTATACWPRSPRPWQRGALRARGDLPLAAGRIHRQRHRVVDVGLADGAGLRAVAGHAGSRGGAAPQGSHVLRAAVPASVVALRRGRRSSLVAALAIAGGAIGPLRRIAEVPLSRAGLADLWSRGGYGTIAVQMIRDTPWTGVGPGHVPRDRARLLARDRGR